MESYLGDGGVPPEVLQEFMLKKEAFFVTIMIMSMACVYKHMMMMMLDCKQMFLPKYSTNFERSYFRRNVAIFGK